MLVRVPESGEQLYRRPTGDILRFMFPGKKGFSVVQETLSVNTMPDICIFKVQQTFGGSMFQFEYMLVECKKEGTAWGPTEDHLHDHLEGNGNDSKNCYGMVQIGMTVQFYQYENLVLRKLGGKMHLVDDADNIMIMGQHIKDNPMSFV